MNQKVTSRQLFLLVVLICMPGNLIHAHAQAIMYAKQHAYLSYIPVFIVMTLMIWLTSRVQRRFKDQDLFQSMVKRSPVLGRVAGSMYIVYFLFVFARDLRLISDYVSITLLETTPLSVILLTLLFMAIFIVRGGSGSIIGMSELYIVLFIFNCTILLPLMLIRQVNLDNLMPYFQVDMGGVLKGSWVIFSYFGELIALPFVFKKSDFRFKPVMFGALVTSLLMMQILIETITSIGVPIASRLVYPSHELARQLQISDFLDRFDLPLAAVTLPVMVTKIAFDLYFVCWGLKRLIPNVSGKILTGPVGLLGYVCSLMFFKNAIQLEHFARDWTWASILFGIFLPIILYIFLRPRKRDKDSSRKGNASESSKEEEHDQNKQSGSEKDAGTKRDDLQGGKLQPS